MKLGFIGCGNMAKAIIKGIISSDLVSASNIYGSNSNEAHAKDAAKELGILTTTNNLTVVENSDIVFLSVKPYQYADVISEIKDTLSENQIIVTIAPGKTIK